MRIIDADQAKEIAEVSLGDIFLQTALKLLIDKVPTLDAVHVAHGYNKYDHDSAFECSVCGFDDWDTLTADNSKYNYCPNCGAKMDRERNEK